MYKNNWDFFKCHEYVKAIRWYGNFPKERKIWKRSRFYLKYKVRTNKKAVVDQVRIYDVIIANILAKQSYIDLSNLQQWVIYFPIAPRRSWWPQRIRSNFIYSWPGYLFHSTSNLRLPLRQRLFVVCWSLYNICFILGST